MQRSSKLFLISLMFCLSLLIGAAYLQWGRHLTPCPLCILQRIWVILIALVCLTAVLHRPRTWANLGYAAAQILLACMGAISAARQIWLQHLPEGQAPACAPDLNFMLDNLPLSETVRLLFTGDGECAKVAWTFLGLSTPHWTLVAFLGLVLLGGLALHAAVKHAADSMAQTSR